MLMRKGKWPTTFMSCVLNEEGLQKRLISHSNLKIRRLSNSAVSQEQRRRRERGTYHFRTLEVLQGSPEVADCLVPEHPLVPDLQQKPGVEAVELTENREKTITHRFLNKIEIQRYVIYSQQKVLFPIFWVKTPKKSASAHGYTWQPPRRRIRITNQCLLVRNATNLVNVPELVEH